MRNLYIVTKNELKRYFISPLAYVYLISFLILNGSFAIYFGHFFERGQADLLPMFNFQPWLYLLFIPGISMRLWAEEFRSKSVIQIMTMPVSTTALVWGKFLASWLFCALALALTFPFWLTVNILGHPDNSIIILSYFGSFILAGCMLAISQTMSALTKNQVIALVLSVIINLLFFLSSLEYVLSFFRLFFPLSIVDMIASFSFITHFDTISRGLLELRDIIFFASIILLFNFTTEIIVSFKTSGTSKILQSGSKKHYILIFIFLLLGFVGLNLLANNYLRSIQYDFTEEKNFTLTPATRKVLQNLPNPVTAKLFYSKVLGDRNPDFRTYFDKVRLLLQQYVTLSNGSFNYQINYVEPMDSLEDYAIAKGLTGFPIIDQSQSAFFGLIITDSINNQKTIPFMTLERQDFIEQDITEAIYTLNNKKKKLGIITTLPLNSETINNVITPRWEIMNQLDKYYETFMIDKPADFQSDMAALMIVHPQQLSQELLAKIKDYSFKGGKVLLFVDIAPEAMNNIAPVTGRLTPSDLGGLDQAWGFHYYPNVAIADLDNSVFVNATGDSTQKANFTQDIVQFLLKEKNFNPAVADTALLKKMLFSSATVIEPDQQKALTFLPLISASNNSALISSELILDNVNPADILRGFKPDSYHKYLAARLTSNDLSQAFDVIVVGDTDMLYDTYWGKNINIGDKQLFIPLLDNANFVLNSLETLTNSDDLITLRGHSDKIRSFDEVEKIRKFRLHEAKIKEKEIMDSIDLAKEALQEVWTKKSFEQRLNFTPDELALIAGIRKKLDQLRQDLQQVQKNSTRDIQKIDFMIKFFNIYTIPLLIVLGLFIFWGIKSPRRVKTQTQGRLNRYSVSLLIASTLMLAAGIISSHFMADNNYEALTDKAVFPKLPDQINDVTQIILTNSQHQLSFYKQDGIWKLKDNPQLVLQDRVRSFLSALLEARYFERKSDKLEYLNKFGLQDFNDKTSPKIEVTLKNDKNQNIESFDVGNYDIDIGRGSRAAYIKFPNQFQVWMISADFIDLSLNSADWTYSQLWNLRLGRLASYNQVSDPYRISLLVSRLLNTQTLSVTDNLEDARKLFKITLYVQADNPINLQFWQKEHKYFVSYDFEFIPNEKRLQLFEKYTKSKYYEISKDNMEKIKNVGTFN